jgi:alkylation response protein AidB-like acyl-CoA dehydrogenase
MAVKYKAPIKDIIFGLDVIDSYNVLNRIDRFKDFSKEVSIPAIEECGKFAEEVLAPINSIGDTHGATIKDGIVKMPPGFKEAYEKFKYAGWASISLPNEIGGGGMPNTLSGATLEMLCSANMAFVLGPGLSIGAISAINFHGSQEQKDKYLPKLVSGDWSGTMNLSEPQSGSDLNNLTTKAVLQEDGTYKITGTKIWIGSGEHDLTDNIIHLVLARIEGAPEGTKGISMFIIPKYLVNDDDSLGNQNNVRCLSIEEKMGIHGSPTCVMEYTNSTGYLIGEENRGLNYMFTTINEARIRAGGHGLSCATGALQGAVQYSLDRVQGRPVGMSKEDAKNSTIIDHADVRRMLMTIKAYTDAMRYMLYDNQMMLDLSYYADGDLKDFGTGRCGLLTPITKSWISDLSVELTSIAIQVYGGMGYVEETGIAQYFRDARIAPIYAGTNGIQALDLVFRKMPFDKGKVVEKLFVDFRTTAEKLSEIKDLEYLGDILNIHTDKLNKVTKKVNLDLLNGDVQNVSASATPYTKMFGQVLGGYYMAKAAILANKMQEVTNEEYYLNKVTISKFYISQLLPLASGYISSSIADSKELFSIKSENI